MTRDYKAPPIPQRAPRRRGGSSSGFFWFVTGAVVGAFGVGLAWMLDERADPALADAAPPSRPAPSAAPKPQFQFHHILPELEVVVPADELAAAPPKPPVPPAQSKPTEPAAQPVKAVEPAPAGGDAYLLQVASFRTAADAERLKAELALQGIQAQIQQVTINGKDTYHRVRAGPYQGRDAANQARARIAGKGLEPIAIRLK
jgi:cell division protein FtsN